MKNGSWLGRSWDAGLVWTRVGRLVRGLARVAGVLLLVSIAGAFVFERIAAWRDDRALVRVGRAVDIGGRTLNIACAGEGSPTVVLVSGRSAPGYVWLRAQREIAAFTRVCWYDRAGLGWSDPGPDPRWGDDAARDLHALLTHAGVEPPLLLVGHSFGGYIIRLYHEAHPADSVGMVFVDVAHEDAGTIQGMPHRARPDVPRGLLRGVAFGASQLGFLRFGSRLGVTPPAGWTQEEWDTLIRLRRRRQASYADFQEGPEDATARLVRDAHTWEQLPVTVLSQGEMPEGDSADAQMWRSVVRQWIELQRALAARAPRSRFVVTNSHHGIPTYAPAFVVSAVRDLVAELRTP